jgi:hypothetical protein
MPLNASELTVEIPKIDFGLHRRLFLVLKESHRNAYRPTQGTTSGKTILLILLSHQNP